MILPGMT